MQQRATFELVKTDDPALFVVKIGGHLGTRERRAVEELVRKCHAAGKRKVVFDFAGLESLGGSVAKLLGDFALELAACGHPPWFIGASPVVQSFLTARFDSITPSFADDLHTARVALSGAPVLHREAPSSTGEPTARDAIEAPAPMPDAPDGELETLSAAELLGTDDAVQESAETPTRSTGPRAPVAGRTSGSVPSTRDPILPERPADLEPGVTRRHSYLTLADAEPLLIEIGALRDAKPVIDGLLFGADLAQTSELFCVDGDRLVQVVSGAAATPHTLPGNGSVISVLRRRAAPVDIVDLTEMDLTDEESDLLTTLECPVVVPVFVENELEGVFFVSKGRAGEEYVSSEELALDLLARQIGQYLGAGRRRNQPSVSEEEKKLRGRVRRQRTVMRLCKEFHTIGEEEQLVSRLLISLIGEMGVGGALFLVPEHGELVARHAYGVEQEEIRPMSVQSPDEVTALDGLLSLDHAEREVWGSSTDVLRRIGIDTVVPLRGATRFFGLIGLATKRAREAGNFDADYLASLVHQAGVAAEHVRAVHELEEQTLRVAKTLIALIEKRIGQGHLASTELVTFYTARVAERLNYDPEHRRDLLYGAVLRDVGMIEISDLVLKSPRSLSPEEWKLVKRHPISGVDLLRTMQFSDVTCDVVLHHHERYNGSGYPHGLRGGAIPQGARIVSVVESYVAMIRDTPYRPALSEAEALSVLEENWEMRYDPQVVDTFARIVREEPRPEPADSVEALLVG